MVFERNIVYYQVIRSGARGRGQRFRAKTEENQGEAMAGASRQGTAIRQGTAMRAIALEEHFVSPGFLDGPGRALREKALQFGARGARLFEQRGDVGEGRIAEMDEAGIDVQVLSRSSTATTGGATWTRRSSGRSSNGSGLGVAPRNGGSCHPSHPRGRVRALSEAADRDRPPGREAAVHAGEARRHADGDDGAQPADHPYGSMARARGFLDQLPLSAADKERIAHGNAEQLFRL